MPPRNYFRDGIIVIMGAIKVNYLMNSNSRYLGSGHISSSTMSSRLSTLSRITSKKGSTVSWYAIAFSCSDSMRLALRRASTIASTLVLRLSMYSEIFSMVLRVCAPSLDAFSSPNTFTILFALSRSNAWYLVATGTIELNTKSPSTRASIWIFLV